QSGRVLGAFGVRRRKRPITQRTRRRVGPAAQGRRGLHESAAGPLAPQSAASHRKIQFGNGMGLERSAQQFDAAVLATAVAWTQERRGCAQPARSSALDVGTKWNFVFIWFTAVGNL